MQVDPQHYGRLDHGVNKTSTLPGAVVPPTSEGYGKLDKVWPKFTDLHVHVYCMCCCVCVSCELHGLTYWDMYRKATH